MLLESQVRQNQRDTQWDTWTALLGFPVMAVWQPGSDGTDINALCRTHADSAFTDIDPLVGEAPYVVTAGDDGRVRLFAYPCVVANAPNRSYTGHASHVMGVMFSPDNHWVVSVGGKDRAAFQWVVEKEVRDAGMSTLTPDVTVFVNPKRLVSDVTTYRSDAVAAPGDGDALRLAEEERARLAELERLKNSNVYEITIMTSDMKGAGTDCGVFMLMYGKNGQRSPEIRLENSPANFARGKTDIFEVGAPDLGEVAKVIMGHDQKVRSLDCPSPHVCRASTHAFFICCVEAVA